MGMNRLSENNNEPLVSIIIPFYCHKEWLENALESVFAQTYKKYEVILINDGSNEDISDLLDKYGDKLIYRKQINQGPAAARNLGIGLASGKYIAFEDSDDIWLPSKLEKQIGYMEKCGADWSHTGFYNWWPESNLLKEVDVSLVYGDSYMQWFVSVKLATPSVVVKRDAFEKEGLKFPVEHRIGEDGTLFSEISKNHPVALIQEPLVKVRMRGSNSNRQAIVRFRLEAQTYKEMIENRNNYPSVIVFIKSIYYLYSKIFVGEITPSKNFIAMCVWTIPYFIERIYVRWVAMQSKKDEKFILRK